SFRLVLHLAQRGRGLARRTGFGFVVRRADSGRRRVALLRSDREHGRFFRRFGHGFHGFSRNGGFADRREALRDGLALARGLGTAAPSRREYAFQRAAEPRAVEVADDVAVETEADGAALFAHDDDDRVGFFRDAERRAVPRAEARVEHARLGHGEEHAGLGDA